MKAFSPLCAEWHQQVKEFCGKFHGHQSKGLALFVWGAIKAESIVLAKVAEALLWESEAKAPSIERRLQRFVGNERLDVEDVWEDFLSEIGSYWKQQDVVLDLTPFEECCVRHKAGTMCCGSSKRSSAAQIAVVPGKPGKQPVTSCRR